LGALREVGFLSHESERLAFGLREDLDDAFFPDRPVNAVRVPRDRRVQIDDQQADPPLE
jgi:hypothetical protein